MNFDRFRKNDGGNVAIIFAVAFTAIIVLAMSGLDMLRLTGKKSELQSIVDTAALTGVRELSLATTTPAENRRQATAVAEATVAALLDEKFNGSQPHKLAVTFEDNAVTLNLKYTLHPTSMVSAFSDAIEVNLSATAKVLGSPNICIVALDTRATDAVLVSDDAEIIGTECSVYSNSDDIFALAVYDRAELRTAFSCTTGGYLGQAYNYDPLPVVDCPRIEDPLALRALPPSGACDNYGMYVEDSGSVSPGTYCGDLNVDGDIQVEFEPGIYYLRDSELIFQNGADITANGVSFVFEGNTARFIANPESSVNISAPTSGAYAGILMFKDKRYSQDSDHKFVISSLNADSLVGTIYLPNADLVVDAGTSVAQSSAYTAIIARRVEVISSSKLILNSNFQDTDVPVPDGLVGTSVGLIK